MSTADLKVAMSAANMGLYIHIHSARCAMDILGLQKREYISVLTRARSARGRADIYSRFW